MTKLMTTKLSISYDWVPIQ